MSETGIKQLNNVHIYDNQEFIKDTLSIILEDTYAEIDGTVYSTFPNVHIGRGSNVPSDKPCTLVIIADKGMPAITAPVHYMSYGRWSADATLKSVYVEEGIVVMLKAQDGITGIYNYNCSPDAIEISGRGVINNTSNPNPAELKLFLQSKDICPEGSTKHVGIPTYIFADPNKLDCFDSLSPEQKMFAEDWMGATVFTPVYWLQFLKEHKDKLQNYISEMSEPLTKDCTFWLKVGLYFGADALEIYKIVKLAWESYASTMLVEQSVKPVIYKAINPDFLFNIPLYDKFGLVGLFKEEPNITEENKSMYYALLAVYDSCSDIEHVKQKCWPNHTGTVTKSKGSFNYTITEVDGLLFINYDGNHGVCEDKFQISCWKMNQDLIPYITCDMQLRVYDNLPGLPAKTYSQEEIENFSDEVTAMVQDAIENGSHLVNLKIAKIRLTSVTGELVFNCEV